jgi:hypothetical protein
MTTKSPRSPSHRSFRLSSGHHGFQPLNASGDNMDNRTTDIPLQTVVSHSPSQSPASKELHSEKVGINGRRRLAKIDSRTGAPIPSRSSGHEETALNRMGRIYTKILEFSIVTRYMIYVAPVALLLAIPIILSQTHTITGSIGGTDQRRFWIWIEISTSTKTSALCIH